jgi:hypothetical protein
MYAIFYMSSFYAQLAMVKNQRLAEKLFNGSLYDCICKFEPVP